MERCVCNIAQFANFRGEITVAGRRNAADPLPVGTQRDAPFKDVERTTGLYVYSVKMPG